MRLGDLSDADENRQSDNVRKWPRVETALGIEKIVIAMDRTRYL
jgi:hypothetical protein